MCGTKKQLSSHAVGQPPTCCTKVREHSQQTSSETLQKSAQIQVTPSASGKYGSSLTRWGQALKLLKQNGFERNEAAKAAEAIQICAKFASQQQTAASNQSEQSRCWTLSDACQALCRI